ncbi:MAG: hypothetical protein M3421_09510, partial [Bacteroidota bacterium]|nr:hypothetical protein [Bacteroidota bacterium]
MFQFEINKSVGNNKTIYVYPTTEAFFKEGNNTYIQNLRRHLNSHFTIINSPTKIGLLDILLNLYKTDVIYFNWIEDIPDRKYGFVQLYFFQLLLFLSKLYDVKIIWFIHNNISHSSKNLNQKKKVISIMRKYSDLILSHSNEIKFVVPRDKFYFFHHPLDFYKPSDTVK